MVAQHTEKAPELTVAALNARGRERFAALGLPSTRREAWRYFPTKALRGVDLTKAAPVAGGGVAPGVAELASADFADHVARIVCVDGRLEASLSTVDVLTAVEASLGQTSELIGTVADSDDAPLRAANEGALVAPLVLTMPANTVIDGLVEILHIATGEQVVQPRLVLALGRSAQLSVAQRFVATPAASAVTYVVNAVTEIVLDDNATLDHVEIVDEGAAAFHVNDVVARLHRDSTLRTFTATLGGGSARTAIRAELVGAGASCALDGLYIAKDRERYDHYTEMDHIVGHTDSSEYYAGIMDDRAEGSFQGLVFMREGARKSATAQMNRNLLLSQGAVANSKPQLEIDNDDVKATHGTTVGQLDELALFYLTSRGIEPTRAKAILTFGFARDAISRVRHAGLQKALTTLALNKLAGSLDLTGIDDGDLADG